MRKTNVFGKKQSQVRPFYAFLLVFIILIPIYMLVNFVLDQRLSALETEAVEIQREINQLISEHQSVQPSEITPGMIYTGFETHHFDYYLKEEIILLLHSAQINVENPNDIVITTTTNNPLSDPISSDITIKEIQATVYVNDLSEMIEFLNILHKQEQLFYIDHLNSSLLDDGRYYIQMTFYTFHLDYID
ncbi:hypothetical protein KHQ88_06220 [Mycoplasmatota bacterium]|nr:hypothetical protein KHQ88_06220 [Mycoplasmatota bacterium]